MARSLTVSYAGQVSRRIPPLPTPRLAHERAILDNWKEDDGVYVTLRLTVASARDQANGPGAADAAAGSPEAPAFLPPPTPRR